MLLDRLTDDQSLFVFACACRMLGVEKEGAIEGVTPLRKLPEPSGMILTSIRAETGLLIGKKQEAILLGGEFGQLNRYMLGADDAAISEADALNEFRRLFPEPGSQRILLFELADIATTILARGPGVELEGTKDKEDITKLIEGELRESLDTKNSNGLTFVLSFVGRGLGAGERGEVEGLISPFVDASAGIIAASVKAIELVESPPEGNDEAVDSSGDEGSAPMGTGEADSSSPLGRTPGNPSS